MVGREACMTEPFDPDAVSKRLSGLQTDVVFALDRLYDESPWLTRQTLEKYLEKMRPDMLPKAHRVVT
jgi:hypothetical protein